LKLARVFRIAHAVWQQDHACSGFVSLIALGYTMVYGIVGLINLRTATCSWSRLASYYAISRTYKPGPGDFPGYESRSGHPDRTIMVLLLRWRSAPVAITIERIAYKAAA